MKLVEENMDMIARAVLSPEEDRQIEHKLGIVTAAVREVTTIAQQTSQKQDKEEFVRINNKLDLFLVKRSSGCQVACEETAGGEEGERT